MEIDEILYEQKDIPKLYNLLNNKPNLLEQNAHDIKFTSTLIELLYSDSSPLENKHQIYTILISQLIYKNGRKLYYHVCIITKDLITVDLK